MTLLSVKQFHERLNGAISLSQVYTLVRQKKILSTDALGKVLIYESELAKLIDPPPPAPVSPPAAQKRHGTPTDKLPLW